VIRLQRKIEVRTFELEATVAVGRERPEFLAVARLAADLARPLSGRDVTRELLGNLPEQVGWLVIDRCVILGLLEQDGHRGPAALTEAGRVALEHGEVLVPEEGAWRFYFVDDPLIDDGLIHVERFEPPRARDERDELHQAKRERRQRPERGERVPAVIRGAADAGYVWFSVATGQAFEVRGVGTAGLTADPTSLRLMLEWSPNAAPSVAVRGELNRPGRQMEALRVDRTLSTPRALETVAFDDAWTALVATGARVPIEEVRAWCERTRDRVLSVAFTDALGSAERRAMRTDLDIPRVDLGTLGRFEPTRLIGVTLVPQTDADAQRWAEWLQWETIQDYATPDLLQDQASQVSARFPYHQPRLLDAPRLLQAARNNPQNERSRFLLAPADLGLWSDT
jgi:hypothetical protein